MWGRLCEEDRSILFGMVVYRLLSCLIIQTYYVPDEYWQSLEVAHQQAFGYPFYILLVNISHFVGYYLIWLDLVVVLWLN